MHHLRPPRLRPGFTLVELLVALLLFDCALLALVGSAALVVRQTGAASRRAMAQLVTENRLARLDAGPCPSPQAGASEPAPGLHERWLVVALDSATRLIDDSVAVDLPGHQAGVAVHAARWCQ